MVIIYIVYGGDFMNKNTYDVVKLFVGNESITLLTEEKQEKVLRK